MTPPIGAPTTNSLRQADTHAIKTLAILLQINTFASKYSGSVKVHRNWSCTCWYRISANIFGDLFGISEWQNGATEGVFKRDDPRWWEVDCETVRKP